MDIYWWASLSHTQSGREGKYIKVLLQEFFLTFAVKGLSSFCCGHSFFFLVPGLVSRGSFLVCNVAPFPCTGGTSDSFIYREILLWVNDYCDGFHVVRARVGLCLWYSVALSQKEISFFKCWKSLLSSGPAPPQIYLFFSLEYNPWKEEGKKKLSLNAPFSCELS